MLHAARWKYRTQKNRHFGTIAQLRRAISSELRHVSTIGKHLLNSNTSSTCPDNMVNFGQRLRSVGEFGAPLQISTGFASWQRYTARHSSSGRQPNFVALNRGLHLYSAGRPSGSALAHISSYFEKALRRPIGMHNDVCFLLIRANGCPGDKIM